MGTPTYGVDIKTVFADRYVANPPLVVDSVVGIVGTAKTKHLKYFGSIKLALASSADYEQDSSVIDTLKDLSACGVECKVVVSGYLKNNDANTQKTNALAAIEELKNAQKELLVSPTFILANGLAGVNYFPKLKEVADDIRAIFFWELEKKVKNEIETETTNGKSSRCVTTFQNVKRADGQNTVRPLSSFVLGNWLKILNAGGTAALRETFSNKPIVGITGIQDAIAHSYTDDKDSNEYRKKGITVAISQPGMYLWGDGVRDVADDGFKVIKDQLITDLIHKRLLDNYSVLIDTPIQDTLQKVLQSARTIMENLRTEKVLYGYSVEPDTKRNTPAAVADGRFWVIVKYQPTINCKYIGVTLTITDEFTSQVLAATA